MSRPEPKASRRCSGGDKDILKGLGGDDLLAGGDGIDFFLYRSKSSGHDTLLDFSPTSGDLVQVSKAIAGVLSPDERDRRIEEDVERYWPTLAEEAARRFVDRY